MAATEMSEKSISHFEWYLHQLARSHHESSPMLNPKSVSSMTAVCFKWPLLFFVMAVCVSWRLQVKGQNRAVWRKASDRKCHFNLSTAAAKPGLAHCPARHFTFSSLAAGMDVKTINFRQSFGLTISDLFPLFIAYLHLVLSELQTDKDYLRHHLHFV